MANAFGSRTSRVTRGWATRIEPSLYTILPCTITLSADEESKVLNDELLVSYITSVVTADNDWKRFKNSRKKEPTVDAALLNKQYTKKKRYAAALFYG